MEDFTDLYGPGTPPKKSFTEQGRAVFKAFSTKFVFTETKRHGHKIVANFVTDKASLEITTMPSSSGRICHS